MTDLKQDYYVYIQYIYKHMIMDLQNKSPVSASESRFSIILNILLILWEALLEPPSLSQYIWED